MAAKVRMSMSDMEAKRFEIEGEELGYPTQFRDGCSAAGLFVVRSAVAQELIPDSGFEIAEIAPGRGILALIGGHGGFNWPSARLIVYLLSRRRIAPLADRPRPFVNFHGEEDG
jgi:hypothetical protein